MANCIVLFCSAFLSFAAVILACVACAGSTKNYNPINKIFEAQLDLSGLNVSQVLSGLGSSIPSLEELGLPSYVNLGLWSYCLANSSGIVSNCTSPSGIQQFNLTNIIYDNINDNQVANLITSVAQITLPDKLEDNMTYYNNLVKCCFITLIIGIIASGLNLVVNILRWILHFVIITWICRFFALIAFLSLLISAGTSTGTYVYIRHALADNYDTYGMKMNLGVIFYALLWASVSAALLNLICLSAARPKRHIYDRPIEEKPLL
ncbi:LANO_0G11518g1_1 [Lachancea nothofagi CBS 11611]|uniref:LANO_0G11518g1_1 n=1 Tax=Lachancea nothofagi CBS 11611 TaxID=1266666 RepID=A0A1G4KJC0_9SACH|nr:LANO_0G11518g1_1 [Lachancea nothofagi CBS 11611]